MQQNLKLRSTLIIRTAIQYNKCKPLKRGHFTIKSMPKCGTFGAASTAGWGAGAATTRRMLLAFSPTVVGDCGLPVHVQWITLLSGMKFAAAGSDYRNPKLSSEVQLGVDC